MSLLSHNAGMSLSKEEIRSSQEQIQVTGGLIKLQS
jgi:hypothetical protein